MAFSKTKSAPSRIEIGKLQKLPMMIQLNERIDKYNSLNKEKNFNWWQCNQRMVTLDTATDHIKDRRSIESFCESDNYSFIRNVSRVQNHKSDTNEEIELTLFAEDYPDFDLIDEDTSGKNKLSNKRNKDNEESKLEAICYTPEKLVRSQKYRILVPPPRYLIVSQANCTMNESTEQKSQQEDFRCYQIDPRRLDSARLREILAEKRRRYTFSSSLFERKQHIDSDTLIPDQDQDMQNTETSSNTMSSESSYDQLNSTWDDCKEPITQRFSLDISSIHSNDCSMEMSSDTTQNMPMSLCDELGIISRKRSRKKNHGIAVNNIASILEYLPDNLEKATILLLEEEDRFCDSTSSHDQLTRLALSIETDEETIPDTNNWLQHLHNKMERLQLANKQIRKDIRSLQKNYQCDWKKVINLSNDATELLEELHDVRYHDDLLELLKGEVKQFSKRSSPFILGNMLNGNNKVNLIV